MNWLWFVLMTILCWGAYIPILHMGQKAIGGRSPSLWAFLLVGVAYFLIAVLAPGGLLAARGDLSSVPSGRSMGIAILAGLFGAVGAFGIILALLNGGKPQIVPSLVFAGAPVVAALVGMLISPPKAAPSPLFFLGILLAAGGAALVLRYRPA